MIADEEKYQHLIRYNKIMITLVGVICVIISGYVFIEMKAIIIPLVLALIINFMLNPIITFFEKKHIPQIISILFVLLFTFLILFVIGHLVNRNVDSFLANIPHYEERFKSIVDKVLEFFSVTVGEREASKGDTSAFPRIADIFENISIGGTVSAIFTSVSTILSDFFIVILYLVFLLVGRHGLISKFDLAFKPELSQRVKKIVEKVNGEINKYILTKTLVSLLTGSLVALALWLFNVEFAFIWGLLTFLLNFIPNIGSIIATIFPITFALVQFDNIVIVIWIAVVLLAIQFLMGNVLEPKVVGKSMGISPVVVLFSLIFWGYVWGIVGMVLAVPIAVFIKIILENISELKPLSVLMGDYRA